MAACEDSGQCSHFEHCGDGATMLPAGYCGQLYCQPDANETLVDVLGLVETPEWTGDCDTKGFGLGTCAGPIGDFGPDFGAVGLCVAVGTIPLGEVCPAGSAKSDPDTACEAGTLCRIDAPGEEYGECIAISEFDFLPDESNNGDSNGDGDGDGNGDGDGQDFPWGALCGDDAEYE